MGDPERCRNKDSVLQVYVQNLTCSQSHHRSFSLREAWVKPTCWSCGISQRGKRQLGPPYVAEMLAVVIFENWESFYHMTQAWKVPFLNHPTTLSIPRTCILPLGWHFCDPQPFGPYSQPFRDIDPLTSDQHQPCAPDTSPYSHLDRDTASSNKGLAPSLQSLDPYNNFLETCHCPPVALKPPNKAEPHS